MTSRIVTAPGRGAQIKVLGLKEITYALRSAAPDLFKTMDGIIRNAAKTVAGAASARINQRSGASAKGYKVRRGGSKTTRFGYRVVNTELGAVFTEIAGSASSGNPGMVKVTKGPQAGTMRQSSGPQLIRTLDAEYGRPGRVMWASWEELEGWVNEQVDRAVVDAERQMQERFDAAPSGV